MNFIAFIDDSFTTRFYFFTYRFKICEFSAEALYTAFLLRGFNIESPWRDTIFRYAAFYYR